MNFKAFIVVVVFALAFVPNHGADSPAELYWKTKLGNITMPKVLKASLQQGSKDEIPKLDPKDIGLNGLDQTYIWVNYAHPTHNQVPQDGSVLYFTVEKLSKVGTKMKQLFKQFHNGAKFLPLHITKSMDVASNKLEVILKKLSVDLDPKSVAAKYIKQMLTTCGDKGIKDEVRYCATSVETMVDFLTISSNLRKNNYTIVSTEEEKDILMEYTIEEAHKLGNDDNHTLVCHKLNNPYVVFLCHNLKSTDVYEASLVDTDGKKMKVIGVCHKDTSDWYPGHLAFEILKVKPGTSTICHFLSGDTIVWFKN